jgi:NAD(P)-dependent dehydrogenase (short-subunit alcohol dehydrogenase family)
LRADRLTVLRVDVTDEPGIERAMADIAALSPRLDLVINTAGVLHDEGGLRPERRLQDVQPDQLLRAFDVNALGTLRLARGAERLLRASPSARFVSLSARVGSIGDNRLGGWYAYRASKAALNMLMRTLSIEWSRLRPPIVCAVLHPGTVDTPLSAPFTANRRSRVFSPAEAAANLLGVIAGLSPARNGEFLAWDGTAIPW